MNIDAKQGLKRVAIVLGTLWAIYWLARTGYAFSEFLDARTELNRHEDTSVYYGFAYAKYDEARARVLAGIVFGFVLPAIAFVAARYFYRGFEPKNPTDAKP